MSLTNDKGNKKMKIALYVRPDNKHIAFFEKLLASFSLSYEMNPKNTSDCTHAISLGGDGTFLSAVRVMGSSVRLPLLGVNSGRLGFLATVSMDRAGYALQCLKDGNYSIEHRSMIGVRGIESCGALSGTALNEFTIQKTGTQMIEIEMRIDGALAASYWADGVIVSTPTGSTAYSMSVSGAILVPSCRCFIVSPIAPHNLSLRPLVLSDGAELVLRVNSRSGGASIATLDNRQYEAPSGSIYTLTKSDHSQQVINMEDNNFYNTLREKLLWGVDLRN